MALPREEYCFMLQLANEACRSSDAINYATLLVETVEQGLTEHEKRHLVIAFKSVLDENRKSRLILHQMKNSFTSPCRHYLLCTLEQRRVESQMHDVCTQAIAASQKLLSVVTSNEDLVFCHKLMGDYHRYLVETCDVDSVKRQNHASASLQAYRAAYAIASEHFNPAHPTRLGLALNFTVYFYDVEKSPLRAIHFAKHVFDEAITSDSDENCQIGTDTWTDSLSVLRVIKDNLVWWTQLHQDDGLYKSSR